MDKETIMDYISILIYMTLNKNGSEAEYWSNGMLGQEKVKKVMSRGRFRIIKKCFSVNNPSIEECRVDPLEKVRPLIEQTQKIF